MAQVDRQLQGFWRWVVICFSVAAIYFAVNQIFNLNFFSNVVLLDPSYHYVITGFLISLVFLIRPLRKGKSFFWIDVVLFLVYWLSSIYLAIHGYDIMTKGYGYSAPLDMVIVSTIIWILLTEALRRSAGLVFTGVVIFFALYPTFASYMPGLMEGVQRSFVKTAPFHILSNESAMGVLVRVFSNILLGYIIFGVAVVATGGSDFLLNVAHYVVGRTRGGPAKIAVIASGLFGSLSGSSMANVLTTGAITIPAMEASGYRPDYAGGIEAAASTAGTLTPPIMGAAAFVLASFIDMPYPLVAAGAALPAFLFFMTLFIQVDGYAARKGLRGQLKEHIPPISQVLLDGWFYLPTLVVLIYFLFVLRWTGESAYIATLVMLILAQVRKKTRFTVISFLKFLQDAVKSAAILLTIMVGAGLLMGSFSLTGIASTFSRELFLLAGGNIFLMLLLTALASLVMGMGMTTIACYIFLALVAAPALVTAGLNELAVHLFVLYCGMLSYITPPVALCAFAAANIAHASPMSIALVACRLGVAKYLLPFFFIIDPALLMQGGVMEVIQAFITAAVGLALLGSAIEGYMIGLGDLHKGVLSTILRCLLIAAGIFLSLPGWKNDSIGLTMAIVGLFLMMLTLRLQVKETATQP